MSEHNCCCRHCPQRPSNDAGGLDLKIQTAAALMIAVADVIKILAGI